MRHCLSLICLSLAIPMTAAHAAASAVAAVAEDKAQALEQRVVEQAAPPAPTEKLTRSEAQAVDPSGQAPLDDSLTCLARTVYWEAKGADAQDMRGVASVVLNRLGKEGFSDSICGVVKQGVPTRSCQFSWWCDGRPDQVEEPARYAVAKEIARKALNQQLPDSTAGALFFHDRHVRPGWASAYERTAQTRHFLFYRPRT